ncbi:MAG: leucyl aminopeptidase family protein [Phycisphaerales bacterium]|nr:leucyl aminopeptidase family protein [Phycisphaerales bacterium]
MFRTITVGKSRNAIPVIGAYSEDIGRRKNPGVPARLFDAFKEGLARPGFKAEVGDVAFVENRLILIGLGTSDDFSTAQARRVGARLLRTLDRCQVNAIQVQKRSDRSDAYTRDIARAFSEGMGLANWQLQGFDGKATKRTPDKGRLSIDATRPAARTAFREGLRLADAANEARRIAETPPNVCNPTWMAGESRKLARRNGLTCRVIGYRKAAEMGMGGIANVGVGSNHKPCLIQMSYTPKKKSKAAKDAHLVLVGKTITYDTGGYSLKISNGMRGMKYDMCGGAAVFGAMQAIAAAKLPIKVTALLPTAENMVSEAAYRPDDVITLYNGVTVEVTNTDAEGRLVLGDALAYACKRLKPTAMVDLATLTGGVVVALGNFSAGMWCNDDAFRSRMDTASEQADERVWRLPLWQEHRDFMRSRVADILNSNPKRLAHPIQGVAFLSFFVDENIPWAHVDIAGMSDLEGNDITGSGATGFGVRMLYELAAEMC